MRRPFVRRIVAGAPDGARGALLAQRFHFAAQPGKLLGQLEHRLVLLRDVPLEVGDLLFEMSNAFGQLWAEISARRPRP